MGYGILEDRILCLSEDEMIDIAAVRDLFAKGADPNAVETNGSDDKNDWDTLFGDCVRYNYYERANLLALLECFLQNGLDLNTFGPLILSRFICMDNKDMYEMAKKILENLEQGTDLGKVRELIAREVFSPLCSRDDRDPAKNDLYGLYRMLEAYQEGLPIDGFRMLPERIGQEAEALYISGNVLEVQEDRLVYRPGCSCPVSACIRMQDGLLVADAGLGAYLDDRHGIMGSCNPFSAWAERALKGEMVERVLVEPCVEQTGPASFRMRKEITIEFSEGKKLLLRERETGGELRIIR